jgi:hypothetical protein
MFAPTLTARCSTSRLASDVVTMPVTAVTASPALSPSTVSRFHSLPMFF